MGIKFPPLYGENVNAYVKEAIKALETAREEYKSGSKAKAASAVKYAQKCVDDLSKLFVSNENQK